MNMKEMLSCYDIKVKFFESRVANFSKMPLECAQKSAREYAAKLAYLKALYVHSMLVD